MKGDIEIGCGVDIWVNGTKDDDLWGIPEHINLVESLDGKVDLR
jgi:hypothetical protein